MVAVADRVKDPVAVIVGIDPLDLITRGHDIPDLALADGEDALDGLLLILREAQTTRRSAAELRVRAAMFAGRADSGRHSQIRALYRRCILPYLIRGNAFLCEG